MRRLIKHNQLKPLALVAPSAEPESPPGRFKIDRTNNNDTSMMGLSQDVESTEHTALARVGKGIDTAVTHSKLMSEYDTYENATHPEASQAAGIVVERSQEVSREPSREGKSQEDPSPAKSGAAD